MEEKILHRLAEFIGSDRQDWTYVEHRGIWVNFRSDEEADTADIVDIFLKKRKK